MIKEQLLKSYESVKSSKNEKFTLEIEKINVLVYENSIHKYDEYLFFIGVTENNKNLFIYSDSKSELLNNFDGSIILKSENEVIKKSDFTHKNVLELQKIFDFTVSKVIGLKNSFGFGDRIGTANPAHLRSLSVNPDFIPVLAQQSIRELTRTQREAEDVMDAAVWAVMQEGFTTGFGADADHLKTTDDIDRMVKAGYKMFTFDPNEHVVNEADSISVDDLKEYVKNLKWKNDEATDAVINRYSNEVIEINNELKLAPSEEDTLRAFVKYGKSILFINKMNNYLRSTYPKWDVEVEVSVDETESVTTPL